MEDAQAMRGKLVEVYREDAPADMIFVAELIGVTVFADGCEIEGTVENCIIFRGTKVSRNSVVKNCILMQDTYVGKNVHLNCVIADKNVVIKDDREISGHPSIPFYLNKGVTL